LFNLFLQLWLTQATSIMLGLYTDTACHNAAYNQPYTIGACSFISGWYIGSTYSGSNVIVTYHQTSTCSDAGSYQATFPPGAGSCVILYQIQGGNLVPSSYMLSDGSTPQTFVGNLTLSLDRQRALVSKTVTATVTTTPPTASLTVHFNDKITGADLGTAITNQMGVAIGMFTSASAIFYEVQASFGSRTSNINPLLFRDTTGKNSFVSIVPPANCATRFYLFSSVRDANHQAASGFVDAYSGATLVAHQSLNNGQTTSIDLTPYSHTGLSTYYSGNSAWAAGSTWAICV